MIIADQLLNAKKIFKNMAQKKGTSKRKKTLASAWGLGKWFNKKKVPESKVLKALRFAGGAANLAAILGGLYHGTERYITRRKLVKKLEELGYSPEDAKFIAKKIMPTSGILRHYLGALIGAAGVPALAPGALYFAFSKNRMPDWFAAQFGVDLKNL